MNGDATLISEDGIVLRPLAGADDFAACVELQRATWGRDFQESVPGSVLKICQKVGGVAAGAFAPDGRLLGFVFGLSGVRAGEPPRLVHWSHMLAVDPAARDLGLGTRLKLYQRELLLPLAIEQVEWTFDPLEARNAHLNLNRLGAHVAEYVEDMYAGEMGSELARGIGTDRLIVVWRIAGERASEALAGRLPSAGENAARFRDAPLAGDALLPAAPAAPAVRVEVPANVQALKAERPDEALAWRQRTRGAFQTLFARGYRVAAFYAEPGTGRSFYVLTQEAGPSVS